MTSAVNFAELRSAFKQEDVVVFFSRAWQRSGSKSKSQYSSTSLQTGARVQLRLIDSRIVSGPTSLSFILFFLFSFWILRNFLQQPSKTLEKKHSAPFLIRESTRASDQKILCQKTRRSTWRYNDVPAFGDSCCRGGVEYALMIRRRTDSVARFREPHKISLDVTASVQDKGCCSIEVAFFISVLFCLVSRQITRVPSNLLTIKCPLVFLRVLPFVSVMSSLFCVVLTFYTLFATRKLDPESVLWSGRSLDGRRWGESDDCFVFSSLLLHRVLSRPVRPSTFRSTAYLCPAPLYLSPFPAGSSTIQT